MYKVNMINVYFVMSYIVIINRNYCSLLVEKLNNKQNAQ